MPTPWRPRSGTSPALRWVSDCLILEVARKAGRPARHLRSESCQARRRAEGVEAPPAFSFHLPGELSSGAFQTKQESRAPPLRKQRTSTQREVTGSASSAPHRARQGAPIDERGTVNSIGSSGCPNRAPTVRPHRLPEPHSDGQGSRPMVSQRAWILGCRRARQRRRRRTDSGREGDDCGAALLFRGAPHPAERQGTVVYVPEAHDLVLMKIARAEAHDLDAVEDIHRAAPRRSISRS